MKRMFTLLLAALLVSAMIIPLAAPANATVDTDGFIDMQNPYEEVTFHVPSDDLTQVYELYIPVEGKYIIQSFGNDYRGIERIALRNANYYVVDAQYVYNGYGYDSNMLLSCQLTGGWYYLELWYYRECDARISITYAQDHYSYSYDEDDNSYLADFDHIHAMSINSLTFHFTPFDSDYAQIALTGCAPGEEGEYIVYVDEWDGAEVYIIDPSSIYLYDATKATWSVPGTMNMSSDQLYYVVVYLGDVYGYGTPVDVATVTVRFERVGS